MKNVLVVGGAGFIGSHLCHELMEDKLKCVYVLDNLVTGDVCNIESLYNNKRFQFINFNAACDNFDKKFRKLCGCIPSVHEIYYLASIASPKIYMAKPLETIHANVRGLENFLELAMRHRARLLYTSTSEVYGDPEVMPQAESYNGNVDPVCRRAVYDESKRLGETLTMAYNRLGVNTRIVRIFNTYGPKMSEFDGRVVPAFVHQALNNMDMTVFGDGRQTRSFCYVSDLVDGLIESMRSDYSHPINLGNPDEYYSMLDLAMIVKDMSASDSGITFQPLPDNNDPQVRRPDISKAGSVLQWKPTVDLKSGLEKTIEHMRQRQL